MSRVIVKNLPKRITADRLREVFSSKGQITDLQLKYTKQGIFRQFAFIGFKEKEEAEAAVHYFHNTFLDTSKISVEFCCDLGDTNKPKAWSKYSKDNSVQQNNFEVIDVKSSKKEKTKANKNVNNEKAKSVFEEMLEEVKDDKEFSEFIQLHKNKKKFWSNDTEEFTPNNISLPSDSEDETVELVVELSGIIEINMYTTCLRIFSHVLSNGSHTQGYCQKLVGHCDQDDDDKSEPSVQKESEKKKIKNMNDEYTVKLKNLPYKCKKKDIKGFFTPLKIVSLRLPPKVKGIAYVKFKTEKQMKQALNKHRGFLSGHRIEVVKYVAKKESHFKDDNKEERHYVQVEEDVGESGRIFVRNLSYTVTEEELEELFKKFGPLTEVHLPVDGYTRKIKGFAFITFMFPEHAAKAFSELDGSCFQGRNLHLLPAKQKKVEEKTITGYKQKKLSELKELSDSSHNWNSLFLGADAVAEVLAEKYNKTKAEILDAETKDSVAVRMALGETELVTETKQFLLDHGIQLDSFGQPTAERSKTVILVKNLPANTKPDAINELFSKFGVVTRVILPPFGITAIVEFEVPAEARAAFKALAYSKFQHVPLYLEWAPINVFNSSPSKEPKTIEPESKNIIPDNDTKAEDDDDDDDDDDNDDEPEEGSTLFVKNINFQTTEEELREHFKKIGPIHSATIAKKKDLNHPGCLLSMGYGFVQYKHKNSAQQALKQLQHSKLNDHALELKISNRATQPVTATRKKAKEGKQKSSKILVKNIPFQATTREIADLFRVFGELQTVRLPKKLHGTGTHRGFGFVIFVTRKDAKRAFKALSNSTHIYGRRLVLEWANTDDNDVNTLRKKTSKNFFNGHNLRLINKSKMENADVSAAFF
ncbi:probable RNA-binding protein 19 [Centruroides sculpturatus]|uniref:probable RNA-binding protein 19 n=1 Tax=Centruroides sculpturatus TaxID=218467 RepID=UPI000C6E3245|nr:probable RNA-binding protein 19 [Centruroides sculpturatus]